MGILTGKIVDGGYLPSVIYRVFKPRNILGNTINGLGEKKFRRPTPIYHWFGILKVPFNRVWWILILYSMMNRREVDPAHMETSREYKDKPYDSVADEKVSKPAEEWASDIRSYARDKGAQLVGIMRVRDEWVFEGFEVSEKWIIVLGLEMDFERLSKAPEPESVDEVMKVYADGNIMVWEISNWLRSKGWSANGYCGPMASPISILPVALAAGFGELGKHGSIINRSLGSNFRLAYILTDVPLVEDTEDEFGADSFCMSCQICTKECPPGAIMDKKQTVRGVEKWYVDFDKCVPFFNDHGGCGICIAVCPWSRPNVRPKLLQKMLKKKTARETSSSLH